MTGIPGILPACAGLSLEKEINVLDRVLHYPQRPLVAMIGGVKLSDKAQVIEHLGKVSESILLGGALANLFLKVQGFEIGKSRFEEAHEADLAKRILRDLRSKIKLPLDVVVSTSLSGRPECMSVEKVKPHQMILDIGPKTILEYSKLMKAAKTLIWSGPFGFFENRNFSHGTFALARLFAGRGRKAFTVAGGGETSEVINYLGLTGYICHVSTGGGAMLDYLAGRDLPGLKVLQI